MRLDERSLRALLDDPALRPPRAARGCPDETALKRILLRESTATERLAFADHLIECSDCSGEYRAAAALAGWSSEAANLLMGADAGTPAPVLPSPRARALPWIAAAAAALLLGSGIVILVSRRTASDPFGSAERSGNPAADAAGAVMPPDGARLPSPPLRLEWAPMEGATSYEVTIYDSESTPIWKSGRVTGTNADLPATDAARLAPGRSYLWRVVGRIGVETRSSPVFGFSISP